MSSVLPIDITDGLKLDSQKAQEIGERFHADYCNGDPFPHIVIDNFLPSDLLMGLQAHFPTQSLESDVHYNWGYTGHAKRQILPADCDSYCRGVFDFFNSQPFLNFLEGVSGIEGLLPDPHFDGGGFHELSTGGKLGVHADFRINKRLHLHRRMNVIIYLNDDWKDEYGAFLELWSRDMKTKAQSVEPIANRCVIFNTTATSYHGHPDPMNTPEDVKRRSLALYYYTASKTVYDEVPDRSTMYTARPGDEANRRQVRHLRMTQHLNEWVPPIILRNVRSGMHTLKQAVKDVVRRP